VALNTGCVGFEYGVCLGIGSIKAPSPAVATRKRLPTPFTPKSLPLKSLLANDILRGGDVLLKHCPAAIFCWGISFFFGCQHLGWVQIALSANYILLQLKAGIRPEQPPHPELEATIPDVLDSAQFYAIWQFRALIAGAIFFIGWRVAEMIRLTYAA